MSGAGRALALSLLAHALPLLALQWPQSRSVVWQPDQLPIRLAWHATPPPRPTVDQPTPDPDLPARRVEIRRRRTIHAPAARPPEPPPAAPPAELMPRAPAVAPIFSAPEAVPPHAVVEVLGRTTLAGPQHVTTARGTARIYFLHPSESAAEVLAKQGTPLILLAVTDDPPADGSGVSWSEAEADTRWLATAEVEGWWALWGTVPPQVGRQAGHVAALWLPSCVRAGWEAESAGALALWDNLEREPSMAGLMSGG